MILRHIKISELTALTSSAEYESWSHVPISPARAISQSLNPYAQPNDTALIIALDDSGNILGYIGAYPSEIPNHKVTRFAWNSCWWITDGAGGDVSMKLFVSFLKAWEMKVAFSDMTEKTFKIVQNLGFCHTLTRDGIVFNFRPGIYSRMRALSFSNTRMRFYARAILYSGLPILTEIPEIILFNVPHQVQSAITYSLKPLNLQFPEDKDFEFIKKFSSENFYIPELKDLTMPGWLVKQNNQNKFLTKKYYFSSFANQFSTFWLRWEDSGRTTALAMLSLRDGVLKTLFIYCEEDFTDKFTKSFMAYCFANPIIRTLVTSQPILTKYISERKFFIFSRKKFIRYSAVSKELLRFFSYEKVLQDGDGDYRFT